MTVRIALLVLSLLATLVSGPAQAQAAPTLDRLLASFSAMPGLRARFHETKQIALLSAPIEGEGFIAFAGPDTLLRAQTSPGSEAALLEGERIELLSEGERQTMRLGEHEVVDAFIETFRLVLRGDRAGLEGYYRLEYEREGAAWTLTLHPRSEALRGFMRQMVLRGTGLALSSIRLEEASGDTTTIAISEVDARTARTPAEVRRMFRELR